MRLREIFIIFLLLLVIMAAMSIPLWWDYASPYIFRIPQNVAGIVNDIKDFIDMILKSF